MKLKPSFSAISPFYCLVLKTFSAVNEMCFYLLNKTLEIWFSTSWVGICFHKNRGKFFQLGKWKPHKGQTSCSLGNHFNFQAGLLEYNPDLHDGLTKQREIFYPVYVEFRIRVAWKYNPNVHIGLAKQNWERERDREYVLPVEVLVV